MSLGNTSETAMLQLFFQNSAFVNVGTTAGIQPSSSAGSFYIALHTSSPGATGSQTTNEAAYTSYARQAVARTSSAWTISGNQPATVTNAAIVQFPTATGGSETETYFSIGTAATGTGQILVYGPLTASLSVTSGIQPSFAAGQLNATCT